jgi:hypothetical protein
MYSAEMLDQAKALHTLTHTEKAPNADYKGVQH